MIRVVFFDAGGVLHEDESETIRRRIAQVLGVDYEQYQDLIQTSVEDLLMTGVVSEQELIELLADHAGVPVPKQTEGVIEACLREHYRTHAETYALAAEVRAAGHMVGIISNTSSYHYKVWALDVEPRFTPIILSHEVKFRKPRPEIFKLALQAAACKPEEAFFTDDRFENVQAAQRLGMRAVHYENPRQLRQALRAALVLK